LLVFDITDRKSFIDIENWMIEAEKYANQKIVKILIGNKSDMEANREVSKEEARAFAASMGMEYIETSAKTTQNVEKTFMRLSEKMKAEFVVNGPQKKKNDPPVILPYPPKKVNRTTCC
jgi:Ras-related protein Rab-1A